MAWHGFFPGLREERLLGAHDGPGAVGQVVNGPDHAGAVGAPPTRLVPPPPEAPDAPPPPGWRNVLLDEGPDGFARAVRAHKGTLLTDTTWCVAAAHAPTGRPRAVPAVQSPRAELPSPRQSGTAPGSLRCLISACTPVICMCRPPCTVGPVSGNHMADAEAQRCGGRY